MMSAMPNIENPHDHRTGDWPRFVWFHDELRGSRYPNAPHMVERFGISYKAAAGTIQRFELSLGAPIAYDESKRGYFLADAGWQPMLPPTWLRKKEGALILAALVLLRQNLARAGGGLDEILVESFLPGAYKRLRDRITVEAIEHHPPAPDVFEAIVLAVVEQAPLAISYIGIFGTDTSARVIEPLALHHFAGNWYLFAHCRTRQALRTFSLDRIMTANTLESSFDYPADFDPQTHAEGVFGIYKGGKGRQARIRFTPYISAWVKDQRWHPAQIVTAMPNGGLEMVLPIGDIGIDLVREVLRFGPDAEILEPADLRAEVASRLEAALAYYQSTPSGP
jgi:predicted DNA-binding transcriptional regulator YafY